MFLLVVVRGTSNDVGVRGDGVPNGVGVIGGGFTRVAGCGDNVGVIGDGGNYGGDFTGGLAPLRLRPSNTQGSPAIGAHAVGELYVEQPNIENREVRIDFSKE